MVLQTHVTHIYGVTRMCFCCMTLWQLLATCCQRQLFIYMPSTLSLCTLFHTCCSANTASSTLCTVLVVVSEPNVTFTAHLDECASNSDIVYCLRIFLKAYNATACVNLNGTVEETPAAAVLDIASNLLVFEAGGKVVLQILSPTPIYRNALVTGLVKKDGCRDAANALIFINGRCVHMQRYILCAEVLNPLECTQEHSTRDLGLLILNKMWWVTAQTASGWVFSQILCHYTYLILLHNLRIVAFL